MTQTLTIAENDFIMHHTGVMYWEQQSVLLISDVHLGKVTHFRKAGLAVPQNAVRKNFDLLEEVIAFFDPITVVFMGDLFHSSLNKEWDLFEEWVRQLSINILLVVGNHDIISPLRYENIGIEVVSEIQESGFLLTHHPEEREGFFNFAGHIHPAVQLRGPARQILRLSCFHKTDHQLILPAFGEFTGTHVLAPQEDSEIFGIAGDEVFRVEIREVNCKRY